MTPSVAAASPTVAPAAPLAVVGTAAHDRAWWAEEAAHTGSDWPSVIDTAIEMMAAGGILKPEPQIMSPWDAPSWREAATEYHRDRSGHLAVVIEPKRWECLRRLMADSISLERIYDEIGRNRATP